MCNLRRWGAWPGRHSSPARTRAAGCLRRAGIARNIFSRSKTDGGRQPIASGTLEKNSGKPGRRLWLRTRCARFAAAFRLILTTSRRIRAIRFYFGIRTTGRPFAPLAIQRRQPAKMAALAIAAQIQKRKRRGGDGDADPAELRCGACLVRRCAAGPAGLGVAHSKRPWRRLRPAAPLH